MLGTEQVTELLNNPLCESNCSGKEQTMDDGCRVEGQVENSTSRSSNGSSGIAGAETGQKWVFLGHITAASVVLGDLVKQVVDDVMFLTMSVLKAWHPVLSGLDVHLLGLPRLAWRIRVRFCFLRRLVCCMKVDMKPLLFLKFKSASKNARTVFTTL